jgi:hypothetical protein
VVARGEESLLFFSSSSCVGGDVVSTKMGQWEEVEAASAQDSLAENAAIPMKCNDGTTNRYNDSQI